VGILIVAAGFVCVALAIFAVAGAVYFVLVRGKEPARRRSGGGSSIDSANDAHYMAGVPFAFDSTDTNDDSGIESVGDVDSGSGNDAGSGDSYADSGSSDSGSSSSSGSE
jgi:hypothetical protein